MIAKDASEMRPLPGSPSIDVLLSKLEASTDGRYSINGTKTGGGLHKEIKAKVGQKVLKIDIWYPHDEPVYARMFRLKDLIKQLLRAIDAEGA